MAVALGVAGAGSGLAEDKPEKPPPEVDQAKIDAAVEKGAEYLRAKLKAGMPDFMEFWKPHANQHPARCHEMVLYALVHAGVSRGDPDIIRLVEKIRSEPPVHTYDAALRAMVFSLYDPTRLRPDLAQCAEFLVAAQGHNGQWGYGQKIPSPPLPKVVFTPDSRPPNYTYSHTAGGDAPGAAGASKGASGDAAAARTAARPNRTQPRFQVQRRKWGQPNDNSNTQYALLGLRACMAAEIYPPPDCLTLAEKWLADEQNADGGWDYNQETSGSTGSMTVGGVSSLSICLRGSGNRKPADDPRVKRGTEWLSKNMKFDTNPGKGRWQYYWIYGVERAGALAETEWFGDQAWYAEGAKWLLAQQKADGSWWGGKPNDDPDKVLDTCWAILFLRRATRDIVQRKPVYTK